MNTSEMNIGETYVQKNLDSSNQKMKITDKKDAGNGTLIVVSVSTN